MTDSSTSYFEQLRPIIEEAGAMALRIRAEGLEVVTKDDGTPVSNADKAVSEFLTRELLAAFPHTKVVSEEHPDLSGVDHPLTWVIDPIDGTKKYVAGRDIWCVMVALFDTQPIASMIYFPQGPVWYWAQRGEGAFVEMDGAVQRLTCPEPAQPLRIAHSPDFTPAIGERGSYGFTKHVRKLLWGKLDAYVRNDIGYWDLVPPMLLATEAGAVCRDLAGNAFALTDAEAVHQGIIICHPKALDAVLSELVKHR